MHEQAAHLAARLQREAGTDPAAQIQLAFELTLCRPPSAEELRLAETFLAKQRRQIESESSPCNNARERTLAAFCLVLLNTNEFTYLG